MSLVIKDLDFKDFRNYASFHLSDIGPMTVFIGENAVGKTNIIEGIELLTSLSSFRHASMRQLINESADKSRLSAHIVDSNRDLTLGLHIDGNRKSYSLNGKKKHAVDLKGLLPSVIFTPDDLVLVKGSQSVRRSEFDALGSQLSGNYSIIKRDYENVVRHKNKLLHDEAPDDLIDAIDEMIITCGAQLTCYRSAFLSRFSGYITDLYVELSSSREKLSMGFIPSWECYSLNAAKQTDALFPIEKYDPSYAREKISELLREYRSEERSRQRCIIGPHHDTIQYFLDTKDATVYGSQGQQRSVVLAYRLSELKILEDMLLQRPILLLDDVMSELDARRRQELMRFIPAETQVFITTTTLSYFDDTMLDDVKLVHLPIEG